MKRCNYTITINEWIFLKIVIKRGPKVQIKAKGI